MSRYRRGWLAGVAAAAVVLAGCQPPISILGLVESSGEAAESDGCVATGPKDQVPTAPKGITIIPLRGADADAKLMAELVREEIDVPVHVHEPVTLDGGTCDEETRQLVVEEVLDRFSDRDRYERATILVASDDIRSSEYAWMFGAWDLGSSAGLISTARLHQFADGRVEQARRHRIRVLTHKYVLILFFNAKPRQDPTEPHLLAPKFSFQQLDATRAGICRHRSSVPLLKTDSACGAPPPPKHGTFQSLAFRESVRAQCRTQGDAVRSLLGAEFPAEITHRQVADGLRRVATVLHAPVDGDAVLAKHAGQLADLTDEMAGRHDAHADRLGRGASASSLSALRRSATAADRRARTLGFPECAIFTLGASHDAAARHDA